MPSDGPRKDALVLAARSLILSTSRAGAAFARLGAEFRVPPEKRRIFYFEGSLTRSAARRHEVDAPIAILSGEGQTASVACTLFGTTKLLAGTVLASLYPDHATYVAAVNASIGTAVGSGFLLQRDGDLIKAWAQASTIGAP
jgi:hypothetical protein